MRQWVVSAVLMLALIGAAQSATAQFGPSAVKVALVEKRPVRSTQGFSATVVPGKKAIIGSAVEGRVLELHVQEGDFVKQGQTIAQLRTGTIEIELAGAEAELALRKAELLELQNGARKDEVAEVLARLETVKARSEFARSRLRRQTALLERKAISQDDFDDAVTAASATEQQVREVEAQLRLVEEGPRKEKISQMEARVLMQQEAVNHIRDRLDKFTVRAYFDGYVTEELTEVGHWIKSGESVVEMCALDEVEIKVMVLEDYVGYLQRGQGAVVTVGAFPGREFAGSIKAIVPQADLRSRTFPVLIRAKNTITDDGPLLKAGMLAQVALPIGTPHEGVVVPKDAVVLGGPQPMVYAVVPMPAAPAGGPAAGGPAAGAAKPAAPKAAAPKTADAGKTGEPQKLTVVPIPVKLGSADGNLIEVLGEIQPGMRVVVQGNERLRPGAEIVISP